MPVFTPLTPVGVEVTDARIDDLDDHEIESLRVALAAHGVVIMPDQEADDEAFLRFVRRFGETVFTVGETPVPGRPELNVVTNVGRTRPPRSSFHTDTSYISNPPAYTALRAVSVPERGGQTLFTNQYAAYSTLPTRMRTMLEGRTITHVVTGVTPDGRQESAATHPIFLQHPVSGRTALYMSTPERCSEVSGMAPGLAAETVAYLFEHSTREENVYRHSWAPGDVVMWDNRCVLHKADHDGVVGDRVLHRGMVAAPA
ncbi:TauD/TfdA family dioxygenase [Mycobacterium yunnanensis]|uniref:TauD/TfdA family dioxygenase n=1 Tax=Mycobacterium yunnanensis TaxID=368477 RepID=A0A9X2YXL0_9MYCO|nr:TauD/TfdA family dioxygenase [Mycobacterium yunnanensis]MCV7419595.1 TauD/TfdA family dioxygenase [Mycobacterium yunnanensis]